MNAFEVLRKTQICRFLLIFEFIYDIIIDEISALCGMTAACLFENFKKINHITPEKYRKIKKTDAD